MDISEIPLTKQREYAKRIHRARLSLLNSHGFFGQLLTYMKFSIDTAAETAYTDGERIVFSTSFLDELTDKEIEFVLMHEVMHVSLQHCFRMKERHQELFNIAADIVVNSNIMHENGGNPRSITIYVDGERIESMHIAPDGKEGYLYTAEEVYDMLLTKHGSHGKSGNSGTYSGNSRKGRNVDRGSQVVWDDHSKWKQTNDSRERELWTKHFIDTCKTIEIRSASKMCGGLPGFAQRLYKQLTKPQLDWRTLLSEFVQQDFFDYTLAPPDRRFGDSPFFLPDYNVSTEDGNIKNILFMVDSSGSISDKMLTASFAEIKGAVDQWDGRLCGWLGFFDARIFEPKPFDSVTDILKIKPVGGGGTDFDIIFSYVNKVMKDDPPAAIVILTDGYAPFPLKNPTDGIPVLWLINNDEIDPPWGKVARITA